VLPRSPEWRLEDLVLLCLDNPEWARCPEDRECYLACLAHREGWEPTDLADQWE